VPILKDYLEFLGEFLVPDSDFTLLMPHKKVRCICFQPDSRQVGVPLEIPRENGKLVTGEHCRRGGRLQTSNCA